MKLIRTNSNNPDFINLVKSLDQELAARDGADHSFYHQFNGIQMLDWVVLAYKGGLPAGIGALKQFDSKSLEVKRMYTKPGFRGQGIAGQILRALEDWTVELGYSRCILETGKRQPEAIKVYEKSFYRRIPNYGHYKGVANSVCFEKVFLE